MSAIDIIKTRRSVRAFRPDPVTRAQVSSLLEIARWSPSGGTLQPWRVDVVMNGARDSLVQTIRDAIAADPLADEAEIAVYPKSLWEPYRTRRFALGEAMYEQLGIPRENKLARIAHLARNFEFFGAPVGLFFSVERGFDKGQWAHLGMFMQTLALAAHAQGLATCMQEAWATRAATVTRFLDLPENVQLYCGMALGYADDNAPVNALAPERADVKAFAFFHDPEDT